MAERAINRYQKGEERVNKILAATVDLISEDGISAVSHRAVARRAKVGDSAPSYFFPSIDDLIVEAVHSIMAAMFAELDALIERIETEDMDRESAVDAYVQHISETVPKYDKIQFEAYLFAERRPALRAEVAAAVSATRRQASTLVTASRRKNFGWAAPILTAFADGYGIHRIVTPPDGIGQAGLRTGLLALMEALPDNPPEPEGNGASTKSHRAAKPSPSAK